MEDDDDDEMDNLRGNIANVDICLDTCEERGDSLLDAMADTVDDVDDNAESMGGGGILMMVGLVICRTYDDELKNDTLRLETDCAVDDAL